MYASEFPSLFIKEPLLTFGEHNQHIDPKLGLQAYGPCLLPKKRIISSWIRLGIIGSKETINLTQQWIDKCQGEIPGKPEYPRLFPSFPGFTKIFGSELRVLDECIELVTEAEIKQILRMSGFNRKVGAATKLFVEKLYNLSVREPRPHVVVCAFPQEIIDSCGTKTSRYAGKRQQLTTEERKILAIIKRHKEIGQTTLVPLDESTLELTEASDLRRLIKAEAMTIGVPTQLARPSTFESKPKDEIIQDEATRAWNFSVALYYKAEGYPWKLAEMSTGTCYIGVSFYRELSGENVKTSMAQVFTHTGEGLVLRGGRAVQDEVTKTPHLSKEDASRLMSEAIDLYRSQMRQLPTRLVVHKSSRYWPEELSGFREAAEGIELMDFVAIHNRGIRFMRREGKYPPLRGTVIQIGDCDYILFTRGYIPYFQTYPGLRIPTPLEIVEHYGDSPIKNICKEILALTKMNWNSADFCIREPITLEYSREVGKILAYVPEEVIPRPEYRYYM